MKKEIAFEKSTKLSQQEQFMQKFFPLTKSELEASERLHAASGSASLGGSDLSNRGYFIRTDSIGGKAPTGLP